MLTNSKSDWRALQAYEQYRRERALSVKHPNPPQGGHRSMIVTFQGKYIHAKISTTTQQPPPAHKRGVITDFSPQSRRRMFDLFHKLNIERKAVFLTLTYGDDYPNAKTAKNHLRALFERIRRKFDGKAVSAIWRMEFQERGAPHFHIVLFNLPFWDKIEIQQTWGAITETEKPFTRIEMIHSHKKLMSYVSKYIAKVNPQENGGFNSPTYLHAYQQKHGPEIGRVWGTFQRQNMPFAPEYVYDLPMNMAKFLRFRDIGIKVFAPIADYRSLGFRLYVRNVSPFRQYFEKMCYDEIMKEAHRAMSGHKPDTWGG